MADIPEPLIVEILSRLPVKPLLQFRCVSKTWLSLIDSKQFISLHLKQSLENSGNQALIIRSDNYYLVEFPTIGPPVEIDLPLRTKGCGGEILGLCNGLVCLYCFSSKKLEGIIVYNPATRDHRELPIPGCRLPEYFSWIERLTYGFGYDELSDDYKLVGITQFSCSVDGLHESEVLVYSLKSSRWRKSKMLPLDCYLSYKRSNGVFVDGKLHWVVTRMPKTDGSKLILSFDLASEEYGFVAQPRFTESGDFQLNVGVLEGHLYAMCNFPEVRSDVWVLTHYGDEKSWVKRFSVPQPGVMGPFNYVKPVAYSDDGTRVLLEQDKKQLLWFDVQKQAAEAVNFDDLPMNLEAEMLVQSLVPLDRLNKSRKKKPAKKSGDLDGFLAKGFKLEL